MPEGCPFCGLASREPERIILETEDACIIPTLGQITETGGYTLVVPKEHVKCLGAMSQTEARIFAGTVRRVEEAIEKEYALPVLMFEHGIVGQTVLHAHLHLLPIAKCDLSKRVTLEFGSSAPIFSTEDLALNFAGWEMPYLFWREPMAFVGRACWNPPAPKQYLRLVVAELLGRKEYGDWKAVHADPVKKAADLALVADTAKRLKARLR